MKHLMIGAAAALALGALAAAPAVAQAKKPQINMKAIPEPELKAMQTCVGGVIDRLRAERASYRAVKPAVAKDCDSQLRGVLAAAIRVGQAGPCTSVEGCIDMARGRAGDEAALDYQRVSLKK